MESRLLHLVHIDTHTLSMIKILNIKQLYRLSILCIRKIYHNDEEYNKWSENWLNGVDQMDIITEKRIMRNIINKWGKFDFKKNDDSKYLSRWAVIHGSFVFNSMYNGDIVEAIKETIITIKYVLLVKYDINIHLIISKEVVI
jgi:hypothetical protein